MRERKKATARQQRDAAACHDETLQKCQLSHYAALTVVAVNRQMLNARGKRKPKKANLKNHGDALEQCKFADEIKNESKHSQRWWQAHCQPPTQVQNRYVINHDVMLACS